MSHVEACSYCKLKYLMRMTKDQQMSTALEVDLQGKTVVTVVLAVPEGEVADVNAHRVALLSGVEDHCVC